VKPALHIKQAGFSVTVQDGGRFGYQRFGVPPSGALDDIGRQIANILVGNERTAGALEIAAGGLAVEAAADSVRFATAGAVGPALLKSANATLHIPAFQSARALRGDAIHISAPKNGAVAYLAIEGGFDLPTALTSLSTYTRAELGGFRGRGLRAGDRLFLRADRAPDRYEVRLNVTVAAPNIIRLMRGPNDSAFESAAFEALFSSTFTVTAASDRMGLRLNGPALARADRAESEPQATTVGALQVPGDGQPILLLADRQTTGGYPRIATVISADIPAAGRLTVGMTIRFQEVSRQEALGLLREQRLWLDGLADRLQKAPTNLLSSEHLLAANLIGGVTTGAVKDIE